MSIGKIISSGVRIAVDYVRKNPKTSIAAAGAGLLMTGFAIKELTMTRKQLKDQANYFALINPFLNPFGCIYHSLNPKNTDALPFDSFVVKSMCDRNNRNYEEYYNNLSPSERIQEFYKNGGKGVL